jgi:thiol-disulfide isomerase/thioredoxin
MKSTNIIITILVLVLIAGGVYAFTNKDTDEKAMMKNDTVMIDEKISDEVVMKADEMQNGTTTVKAGTYQVYSPEKIMASAQTGNVVLFFKANWCPSCRTLDADIKSNLSSIPSDLTVLEVDYDKSADLKKKYGVTTQHTLVQVDKDGNMIKKWSGGNTLNSVVSEIK